MARVLITESKRYVVYERKDTLEFVTSDGKESREIVFLDKKARDTVVKILQQKTLGTFDQHCSDVIYHEGDLHGIYRL